MSVHISELPPIRHSMRQKFKSCPRKTFWEFVAGIEPKGKPVYFAIGTAYHKGLELWRGGMDMDEATEEALDEFAKQIVSDKIELEPWQIEDESARIAAYLGGYPLAFSRDSEREWLESELQIIYRGEQGTIDAHFKEINKSIWIVDDKTRTFMTKNLDDVVRMDEQLLNYALLLQSQGVMVQGAYLREVKKAGIKRTKKETAKDYAERVFNLYQDEYQSLYQESRVEFEPAVLQMFHSRKSEINHVMRQLMQCVNDRPQTREEREKLKREKVPWEAFSLWPWNGDNCVSKFGNCEYVQLCANRCDTAHNFKPTERRPIDDGTTRKLVWGYDPAPARTKPDTRPEGDISSPPIC